jgi:hypothetical protein
MSYTEGLHTWISLQIVRNESNLSEYSDPPSSPPCAVFLHVQDFKQFRCWRIAFVVPCSRREQGLQGLL